MKELLEAQMSEELVAALIWFSACASPLVWGLVLLGIALAERKGKREA